MVQNKALLLEYALLRYLGWIQTSAPLFINTTVRWYNNAFVINTAIQWYSNADSKTVNGCLSLCCDFIYFVRNLSRPGIEPGSPGFESNTITIRPRWPHQALLHPLSIITFTFSLRPYAIVWSPIRRIGAQTDRTRVSWARVLFFIQNWKQKIAIIFFTCYLFLEWFAIFIYKRHAKYFSCVASYVLCQQEHNVNFTCSSFYFLYNG